MTPQPINQRNRTATNPQRLFARMLAKEEQVSSVFGIFDDSTLATNTTPSNDEDGGDEDL
jgi:hypothetical protein